MFYYNTQHFLFISPSMSLKLATFVQNEGSVFQNKAYKNNDIHQM
jgi:hypothetical protein